MDVRIGRLTLADANDAVAWVEKLLAELGEEAEDAGALDRDRILAAWRDRSESVVTFVARDAAGRALAIATVVESFAIYANGAYGIINEMYVIPEARSMGVGTKLVDAVKELGRQRDWSRIDVTAPESPRWGRTRRFYERQGFVFSGPKLRFGLR